MTDPLQELARRAVVAKLVADEARAMADKPAALASMIASGARTVDAIGPDGTVYGTVSRCSGRKEAVVTDEDAFFAWVLERHPERIIRLIDPEWKKSLLSLSGRVGGPIPVEAATGEPIPGVELLTGSPYVSVRSTEDGRDLIRAALDPQRGTLFALPPGADSVDAEDVPSD